MGRFCYFQLGFGGEVVTEINSIFHNLTTDPVNGTLTYNDAGQLISASAADGGYSGSGAETVTYAGASQDQPGNPGNLSPGMRAWGRRRAAAGKGDKWMTRPLIKIDTHSKMPPDQSRSDDDKQ